MKWVTQTFFSNETFSSNHDEQSEQPAAHRAPWGYTLKPQSAHMTRPVQKQIFTAGHHLNEKGGGVYASLTKFKHILKSPAEEEAARRGVCQQNLWRWSLVTPFPVRTHWRIQWCAANVSQATVGHIGHHNWQVSPVGLIRTPGTQQIEPCESPCAHHRTCCVICSEPCAHTLHTRWNIGTSCWKNSTNAGRAASFHRSCLLPTPHCRIISFSGKWIPHGLVF